MDAKDTPDREVPDDVGLAVDDLRRSMWGALTTTFVDDAADYLVSMRVRRSTEMLKEILADLYTGAIGIRTPGTGDLRAATSALRTALEEVP